MEFANLIKGIEKNDTMKKILKASKLRDFDLFALRINRTLRISNLLVLTVSGVMENGKIRNRITLRKQKTGKSKNFPPSNNAHKAINIYLAARQHKPEEPLFFISRK